MGSTREDAQQTPLTAEGVRADRPSRREDAQQRPRGSGDASCAAALVGAGAPTESSVGLGASAVALSLPGLNIQWPFSQLVLSEAKTEEVREYDLGHRNIQLADVETYLVETPGPTADAARNAVVDGAPVGPRPEKSRIVAR